MGEAAVQFEWADVKQNLRTLQEVTVEERGRTFAIRVAMGPLPYSEIYRALKAHTVVDDCRRYNLGQRLPGRPAWHVLHGLNAAFQDVAQFR